MKLYFISTVTRQVYFISCRTYHKSRAGYFMSMYKLVMLQPGNADLIFLGAIQGQVNITNKMVKLLNIDPPTLNIKNYDLHRAKAI